MCTYIVPCGRIARPRVAQADQEPELLGAARIKVGRRPPPHATQPVLQRPPVPRHSVHRADERTLYMRHHWAHQSVPKKRLISVAPKV